jgi:hypothetical protein
MVGLVMKDIIFAFAISFIPTLIVSAIWAYFIDKSFNERTKRNETVHQTTFRNI